MEPANAWIETSLAIEEVSDARWPSWALAAPERHVGSGDIDAAAPLYERSAGALRELGSPLIATLMLFRTELRDTEEENSLIIALNGRARASAIKQACEPGGV